VSRGRNLYVLPYDVSDDSRRRRIAEVLEDEGTRVQFSVFEARLSKARIQSLTREILEILSSSDSLRVYSIGRPGESNSTVVGSGVPIDKAESLWIF
jgi:CRISPR-associated protein Cas2